MVDMRKYRRFLSSDDWEIYSQKEHPSDLQLKVPPPPIEKPFPDDARLIDLVLPDQLSVGRAPLLDVIRRRESRRKFMSEPLGFEELSFLLWATQGIRNVTDQDGRPLRSYRTVPSGGGRHALETYLVISRVTGLAPKMILLDAGHVCQNLYLAAEAIGAGTCAIAAYRQKPLDELIGVDGEDEFVMYLAPVGRLA